MNCIFCKSSSSGSVSIEHIIPESLGNTRHVLPRGIVCDKCNNYFSRKLEKPLLDTEYFTHKRFRNFLPNKMGRIPAIGNVSGPEGIVLELGRELSGMTHVYPVDDKDSIQFLRHVLTHKKGYFIIPNPSPVNKYLVSRFLSKIALEVVAHKVMNQPGWEKDVVFRPELDELRYFARYGDINKVWPFFERRLYEENHTFLTENGERHQILHEFDTLYTRNNELFVIMAILGVEYTINVGGPEIDGYLLWLEENGYGSPLYPKKSILNGTIVV
jgi:hypothetical protein